MKAINEIRPGMTGAEADAISRNYLESKGYGKEFGHSLGHGIGLEIHEGPMLARTIQDKLQVNNLCCYSRTWCLYRRFGRYKNRR